MKKKFLSGAIALGLALSTPLTSSAADTTVTVDGITWTTYSTDMGFSAVRGDSLGALGLDQWDFQIREHGTTRYDGIECLTYGSPTTESDGDVVIPCSSFENSYWTDLTVGGSLKVFSGSYAGLVARGVYTVTNTSASPKTIDYRWYINNEECEQGAGNIGTSSSDLALDTSDNWLICNNNDKGLEGMAWGPLYSASAVDYELVGGAPGSLSGAGWYSVSNESGFTIPAGATKTWVLYYYSVGAKDHTSTVGVTDAEALTNMASFFNPTTISNSRLMEGVSSAVNWNVQKSGSGAELAETGANSGLLAFFAIALMLTGATAVLAVSRKK